MLSIFKVIEEALGREKNLEDAFKEFVRSSLAASHSAKRQSIELESVSDNEHITKLSLATLELLQMESRDFTPFLLPYIPDARMIAGDALHQLFGAVMLPWMVSRELIADF
jgi:ribosomal protein L20A (L18A)